MYVNLSPTSVRFLVCNLRFTTQTRFRHGRRHWFAITSVSFQTAYLIGLILRHNVGAIILYGLQQPRYRRELCGMCYHGLRRWGSYWIHSLIDSGGVKKIFYTFQIETNLRWRHHVWPLTSDVTLIFILNKVLALVMPMSKYQVSTMK